MATSPSTSFCPRRAWALSIDEVLLEIRLKRLQVGERRRLKALQEEMEYWRRWRRAQKLKKERQFLEARKEKQRMRRREDEAEALQRFEQRRRRDQHFRQHQQGVELLREDEDTKNRYRRRSMDRSRIAETGGARRQLRRMNSVDNFH